MNARLVTAVAAVLLLAGTGRTPSRAEDPAGPSDDALRAARTKGLEFLRLRMGADGGWGPVGGSSSYGGGAGKGYEHPLGSTALCMYAMLASGVPKDDPAVKKGFAYLDRTVKTSAGGGGPSAYELSALLLATTARAKGPVAWRRGDVASLDGDDKRKVQAYVDLLLDMRTRAKTLGWRYGLSRGGVAPGGNEDLSSTGFAALALFAADRCGARVPDGVWGDLVRYAIRQQDPRGDEHPVAVDEASIDLRPKAGDVPAAPDAPAGDAPTSHARGFAYIRSDALAPDEGTATGGMTACGVATITLARLTLGRKASRTWTVKDQAAAHEAVLDGCAWLDANWSPSANPKKKQEQVYHVLYLLHVADALDLVGSSRVGSHAWFDEMSHALLGLQKDDGSWDTRSTHEPAAVLDTAFALLFLARPFAAPAAAAPAGK